MIVISIGKSVSKIRVQSMKTKADFISYTRFDTVVRMLS